MFPSFPFLIFISRISNWSIILFMEGNLADNVGRTSRIESLSRRKWKDAQRKYERLAA